MKLQPIDHRELVVCDSVLNSVTSVEAENGVLTTVNAFCKLGGTIVFSGRSPSFSDRLTKKRRTSTGKTRDVWFLDKDGITATRRTETPASYISTKASSTLDSRRR